MADVELTTNITLNSQTVDITVYEDVNSTGTTDNQETVTGVAGGTTTNLLSSLTGGPGNTYWAKIDLSSSNATQSPVVHSVTVDVPVAGSVILLQNDSTGHTNNGNVTST